MALIGQLETLNIAPPTQTARLDDSTFWNNNIGIRLDLRRRGCKGEVQRIELRTPLMLGNLSLGGKRKEKGLCSVTKASVVHVK